MLRSKSRWGHSPELGCRAFWSLARETCDRGGHLGPGRASVLTNGRNLGTAPSGLLSGPSLADKPCPTGL